MPTPVPPTQASIKITKAIPYRGGSKAWSNRYFFGSLTSLTTAQFNALYADIVAAERLIMSSLIGFASATGYDGGSEIPVHSATLSGSGTMTHTGDALCPGDCAAMMRFSTTQRTSKNHPIYLFKWYHGVYYATAGSVDTLLPSQKTVMDTFAGHCVTGFSDGVSDHPISGPYGAVAQSALVSSIIRHRDFRN